jgi:hypothetical protein
MLFQHDSAGAIAFSHFLKCVALANQRGQTRRGRAGRPLEGLSGRAIFAAIKKLPSTLQIRLGSSSKGAKKKAKKQ